MKERMKLAGQILLILFLYALLATNFSLLFAQETIIDTVYSIPELDGGIGYVINNGIYMVDNSYGAFYVGDCWAAFQGSIEYCRGFLAYPLPDIPENYSLNSSTLFVYQYFSVGNNVYWDYPIFNLETGDVEPPCLIEHINYGYSLEAGDFNLPALHPADTISTTPEQDWRSLEITEWVIDDIENNRPYTQSRLRLSLDYDLDYWNDMLMFLSGNTIVEDKPYCVYEYINDSNVDENWIDSKLGILSVYPNPVNRDTKIKLSLSKKQQINIDLFNIKGQIISNLYSGLGNQGRNEISFNMANLSSGIYFLKFNCDNKKPMIKKIIVLK